MQSSGPCSECEAITRELAEAYLEWWDSADPKTQRAWTAVFKMRTEEELRHAEELIKLMPRRPDRHPPTSQELQRSFDTRVMRAQVKRWNHESRSGHKVPFREPF